MAAASAVLATGMMGVTRSTFLTAKRLTVFQDSGFRRNLTDAVFAGAFCSFVGHELFLIVKLGATAHRAVDAHEARRGERSCFAKHREHGRHRSHNGPDAHRVRL